MSKFIAGVDPGLNGAIALYRENDGALQIMDMPTLQIKKGNKTRNVLDIRRLADFMSMHDQHILRAVIENVHAMPGQGVTSMFSFGVTFGATQAIFAAFCVPFELVEPAVWKKAMKLTGDKDASRLLASRLLPKHSALWARKKDDGRAEAALLAVYGAKQA